MATESDTGRVNSDGITNLGQVFIDGVGAEAGAEVQAAIGAVLAGRTTAAADGSYRIGVQGLTEGVNAVVLSQTDLAGNTSNGVGTARVQVTYKASVAAPAITGLLAGSDSGVAGDGITNQLAPTIQGTGAEPGATVRLFDGARFLGEAQAGAKGEWSVALSAQAAGVKNIVARQLDVAGNVSASSEPLVLTIDTTALAPTFALVADVKNDTGVLGDNRTQNANPTYSGTAEAGATVTLWRTDQATRTVLATAVADASGAWQATVANSLAPASYAVAVSQTDAAGNTSVLSAPAPLVIQPNVTLDLSALLAGGSSGSVRLTDVNGDGLVDVVAGAVFLQLPDGTFTNSGLSLAVVTQIVSGRLISARDWGQFIDLDGDDKPDYFTLNNEVVTDDGVRLSPNTSGRAYKNNASGGIFNLLGEQGPATYLVSGLAALEVSKLKYVQLSGSFATNSQSMAVDINQDGFLDIIYGLQIRGTLLGKGDGTFLLSGNALENTSTSSSVLSFDANGDGLLDLFNSRTLLINQGAGTFVDQLPISGLATDGSTVNTHAFVADFNADGLEDIVMSEKNRPFTLNINAGGVFTNAPTTLIFEESTITLTTLDAVYFAAGDINGDRSVDLLYQAVGGALVVKQNITKVEEDTYLRVVVTDVLGSSLSAAGATVGLYDASSGALVGFRSIGANVRGAYVTQAGNLYAEFFGLDPKGTYNVVVRYPGSDQGVVVVGGVSGQGTEGIAAGLLKNIVDPTLKGVSPGGKDVLYVSPEDVTVSTTGGKHVGSQYADWFVGDKGDDVFTPNGAPIGEAGDTIDLSNGGSDTVIFQQLANLNTAATIKGADVTAAIGAGNQGDVIDIAGLLTAIGYTGPRSAAGIASVVQVSADGTGLKIRVNKPVVGFQDLATITGANGADISGKTLADLVSSGHLRLGGLSINGVLTITVAENSLQATALAPFEQVTLAPEGGVYAKGFTNGYLKAAFDKTYTDDVWKVIAGGDVTVSGNDISVAGVGKIATVDGTLNGVGKELQLNFDFSATSLSAADQAAAVQKVAHAIHYENAGTTPPDYARALSIEVSDGSAKAKDASLLTITPVADTETIGGKIFVTGSGAADTLTGTGADETFVGYGGPVANAGLATATGDTLTGGGGHDTYLYRAGNVGRDTIADFTLGAAATANTDNLNLADLLEGFTASSNIADFVRIAANGTTGVSVQVDFNGKADGSAFTPYMQVDLTGVTLTSAATAYNTTVADLDALRAAMVTNSQLILA